MSNHSEENRPEDFGDLQRLLSLKRHEVPPPRFFDELPGRILARVQKAPASRWEQILDQLFATRWFQPLAAGGMAVLVGGLFFLALDRSESNMNGGTSATLISEPRHPASFRDQGLPAQDSNRNIRIRGLEAESLQPISPR